MVDQEIHRALEYKFNMTIPVPLDMTNQYWDEGHGKELVQKVAVFSCESMHLISCAITDKNATMGTLSN